MLMIKYNTKRLSLFNQEILSDSQGARYTGRRLELGWNTVRKAGADKEKARRWLETWAYLLYWLLHVCTQLGHGYFPQPGTRENYMLVII